MDIFKFSKGANETRLGLIVKTEDMISLYTAEPQHFNQPQQSKSTQLAYLIIT